MSTTRQNSVLSLAVIILALQSCYSQKLQPEQQNVAPLPEWVVFARRSKVEIQILEPRGIQIWTKYKPKYVTFGVELYVNPTERENVAQCNLCRNVSGPIHGKFFIQDNDVLVKLGDTIKFRVVKIKPGGEEKWSPWKYVFVDKQLFFQSEEYCTTQCERSEELAKVRYLESYLENMISNSCGSIEVSEQLFFKLDRADLFVDDPLKFVKSRLYTIDLLRPLVDHVENCYVSQDGVGFKMRTIVEKLKVLDLARQWYEIVDYDEYMVVPSPSV